MVRAIRRNKVRNWMKFKGIRHINKELCKYFRAIRTGARKMEGVNIVKHGKNPTVVQKKIIKDAGLDPRFWLVTKNRDDMLKIVHRQTGEQREIKKPA